MAKRKRLSPVSSPAISQPDSLLETKSIASNRVELKRSPAPIAEVSGTSSLRAALAEVTEELTSARNDGRFVMRLPLANIDATYLVRDRIEIDSDDLQSLIDSLRVRGQQTPIEVVDLGSGQYGLISGWRRLAALRHLVDEANDERFATIQALVRKPDNAAAAYLAMVEENEIRVGLSFYERARIAVQAVRQGVHENTAVAVAELFAAARAPKRSKILSFVTLVEALDMHLQFPAVVPEKLGLALVAELRADTGFRRRLTEALRKAAPTTPGAERAILEQALVPASGSSTDASPEPSTPKASKARTTTADEVIQNVQFTHRNQRLILSGSGVTAELAEELRAWLASRNHV